ncbi:predicted protein [Histoplasma mississippiense (nom. inval.)]|uniref:predicted protein n=1 Tax=Ajellomyces capsulatus (strain NAm1 / WU24) TaxID=2059318 RepID=UPI000157C128|nr:predicted protein [Histoplasma mississippiense (nom. inval.)]EDN07327.1 predicted protein [Histoplasma mississippiense (nom. inval.)]
MSTGIFAFVNFPRRNRNIYNHHYHRYSAVEFSNPRMYLMPNENIGVSKENGFGYRTTPT